MNPVPLMKLVEIVRGLPTSQATVDTVMELAKRFGKTTIGARDIPGFIVNRCARPYYGEALAMLAEGRSAAEIDAAMVAAGTLQPVAQDLTRRTLFARAARPDALAVLEDVRRWGWASG